MLALAFAPVAAADGFDERVQWRLQAWIDGGEAVPVVLESLSSRPDWGWIYRPRDYRPLWLEGRELHPRALQLVLALTRLSPEGLPPLDRHMLWIVPQLLNRARDAQATAELDLWLTDALLRAAQLLYRGQVDPAQVDPEWHIPRPRLRADRLIGELERERPVLEILRDLVPHHPGYRGLRAALERYREVERAGGWPRLPPGPRLELGSRDLGVLVLRRRLTASGDLSARDSVDPELFDLELAAAVRRFQARHGLTVDGVVGPQTRALLDLPVAYWIERIALNLERWRWLPRDMGVRHLLVNVPAYALALYDGGEGPALQMRVIVGRTDRETPVFTAQMTDMVLNPAWYIPARIAYEDILPRVARDSDYMERRSIRMPMPDGAVSEGDELLRLVRENGRLPYPLRQDPGPDNALGRIKFRLPNRFAIYLHDTPQRDLFQREQRAFSSGCIRLEQPLELAGRLLDGDPRWSTQELQRAVDSGVREVVPLAQPVPVYLTYFTAWVEDDGTLYFGPDVYGRDAALHAALFPRAGRMRGNG